MRTLKPILIVEDDEGIRDTLSLMLQMEGYEVMQTSNGQEALELLGKIDPPSLILLDLMMPVMNGFEFAAAIEQQEAFSSIPIVLLTAYTEHAHRVRNAKCVLFKPVEFDQLFQTVREYCG
ncbi:response regulator [Oligoflexus tunisiensis]|uniref:response regulator n=1 Tax=Oligoflexus tunisiensis TaxID=708132 RepID=UPI00114CF5B1|nr:response regulator [Oligoflexus tunisiensis]